jgi:hypothetical protein
MHSTDFVTGQLIKPLKSIAVFLGILRLVLCRLFPHADEEAEKSGIAVNRATWSSKMERKTIVHHAEHLPVVYYASRMRCDLSHTAAQPAQTDHSLQLGELGEKAGTQALQQHPLRARRRHRPGRKLRWVATHRGASAQRTRREARRAHGRTCVLCRLHGACFRRRQMVTSGEPCVDHSHFGPLQSGRSVDLPRAQSRPSLMFVHVCVLSLLCYSQRVRDTRARNAVHDGTPV